MNRKSTSFNKIQNWTDQIDQTTKDFQEAFGKLTDEQLNWKPNDQSWSIAQNIEHLMVINESYFPILKAMRKGEYKTSFLGNFGFITKALGTVLLKSVQPERKRKTKTFAIWAPTTEEEIIEVLKKFEGHQKELKQQIQQSQDLLENDVIIASPANKNMVYSLETAFDVMITHERRHLQQAKEVFEGLSH